MNDQTLSPDTPYEHKVCQLTLICSLIFLAAGAYYFLLADPKDPMAVKIVMITGGIFILSLVNFFIAAFSGKICGQQDNK